MDTIDIVGHTAEKAKASGDGHNHGGRSQHSIPVAEEDFPAYDRALEDMGNIVNSSDSTFKRNHVGVIWKNLTVQSDIERN